MLPQGVMAFVDPDKPFKSSSFVLLYLGNYDSPVFRQIFIDGPNFEAVSTNSKESVFFRRVESPGDLTTHGGVTGKIIGPVIYCGKVFEYD